MLRNLILISLRNFIRRRGYSLINVTGLMIGLTASMLILLYVFMEIGYDRFHNDPGNICRIVTAVNMGGKEQTFALSITPLGPVLAADYPEVLSYTRINRNWNSMLMSYQDRMFYEDQVIWADSGFLRTFDFGVIQGDPSTMLTLPYTMAITESMAKRYFGEEDPVDKFLKRNNGKEFRITGVLEDPPLNSHFRYSAILSFCTMYQGPQADYLDEWAGNINYLTYIRLAPGTDHQEFTKKVNETIYKNAREDFEAYGFSFTAKLQPITDIHLKSDLQYELEPNSSKKYVMIFAAVAIIILVIAAINFMNLSTARSAYRAKEIGIRKVAGASRKSVILQFLMESVIYSLAAFLLSLALVNLLLDVYGGMMNRQLEFTVAGDFNLFLLFLGLSVLVGLLAGLYPAFFLSAFQPEKVLKGNPSGGRGGALFRNVLVILQFLISVALIISTLVIYQQLSYIRNTRMGFNESQVIIIPIRSDEVGKNYKTVMERLNGLEGVEMAAASQNYFSRSFSGDGYRIEGSSDPESLLMRFIDLDPHFFELYEMEISEGRNFSYDFGKDELSVIPNEAAVRFMGLEDPLGKRVMSGDSTYYTIIGVARDFHYASLRENIEPVMIHMRENRYNYLNVRLSPFDTEGTLFKIKELWKEIDPTRTLDYFFLDTRIDRLYDQERRMGQIFIYFTFLAIFVALLGLFGLSSYVTEQRTAEIGIRKVMGSSSGGIVLTLSLHFIRLVLLSNLLAWPAAWFLMKRWLQDFAYHPPIAWWSFILATLASVLIALLTVGLQSFRAATANPADSLRYE